MFGEATLWYIYRTLERPWHSKMIEDFTGSGAGGTGAGNSSAVAGVAACFALRARAALARRSSIYDRSTTFAKSTANLFEVASIISLRPRWSHTRAKPSMSDSFTVG